MKKQITAIYHNNYNGWSLSVDDVFADLPEVTDTLCDITIAHCEEDGEYFYNHALMPSDETAVRKTLRGHFGDEVTVKIEIDSYSS